MCINALAFSVKHNIFKILLLDKKLRVQCFLESIFSFLAWCREGAQRYRTSFKNKETKKISRVLSSVQGSFPVLLIKLWDIETQAKRNEWMENITLFIYRLAYRYTAKNKYKNNINYKI